MIKIDENVSLASCDLFAWDRDDSGQVVPESYVLGFVFYGEEYSVVVSADSLSEEYLSPDSIEGANALFNSFEEFLDESDTIWDVIRGACAEVVSKINNLG